MSRIAELAGKGGFQRDEVGYVSGGEGQTSEGEFWEAISTASNLKLPVLFLIEDNGYAISVPVEVNVPGGSISKLIRGFPNFFVTEVDGTDFLESYDALRYAAEYCRARMGPALVHARVIRPYSHSLSDDEAAYRPKAERDLELEKDPVRRLSRLLLDEGVLQQEELESLHAEVDAQVDADADRALAAELPAPESAYDFVYSPDVDPTSSAFSTQPVFEPRRHADDDGRSSERLHARRDEAQPRDRHVRRGRRGRLARGRALRMQGQGRRLQAHGRPAARVTAPTASSTRRWPRPTSSAARSAWRCGD